MQIKMPSDFIHFLFFSFFYHITKTDKYEEFIISSPNEDLLCFCVFKLETKVVNLDSAGFFF